MQMDNFYLFNTFESEMRLYFTLTQNLTFTPDRIRVQNTQHRTLCVRTVSRLMLFMEIIGIFSKAV